MGPFWVSAFLDLAAGDFDPGVRFWRAVTGFGLSPPRGPAGEFATLVPPDGDDYLRVQRLGTGPSRIHLDLHVADPRAAADAAVRLGAHRGPRRGYVALTSPGGFTFCFVAPPGRRPTRARHLARRSPGAWSTRCVSTCPGRLRRRERVLGHGVGGTTRGPGAPARVLAGCDPAAGSPSTAPPAAGPRAGAGDRPPGPGHHRPGRRGRPARGARRVPPRHRGVLDRPARPGGTAYCVTDRDPATGRLG